MKVQRFDMRFVILSSASITTMIVCFLLAWHFENKSMSLRYQYKFISDLNSLITAADKQALLTAFETQPDERLIGTNNLINDVNKIDTCYSKVGELYSENNISKTRKQNADLLISEISRNYLAFKSAINLVIESSEQRFVDIENRRIGLKQINKSKKNINESASLYLKILYDEMFFNRKVKIALTILGSLFSVLTLFLVFIFIIKPMQNKLIKATAQQLELEQNLKTLQNKHENIVGHYNSTLNQLNETEQLLQVTNQSLQSKRNDIKRVEEESELFSIATYNAFNTVYKQFEEFEFKQKKKLPLNLEPNTFFNPLKNALNKFNSALRNISQGLGIEMQSERVYLSVLISEVLVDMAKPSNLDIQIDSNLPVTKTNKNALFIVIYNIIENAIKYNTSDMPTLQINCEEKSNTLHIRIKDNGSGISNEHIQLVFQPFIGFPVNHVQPGNGIGLALAKRLCTRVGGNISIASEKDKGCEVLLVWPSSI